MQHPGDMPEVPALVKESKSICRCHRSMFARGDGPAELKRATSGVRKAG
jgi:hypothetical protein